jgi:hypothetical protein
MTLRLAISSISSNIFNIFVNLYPTLIAFLRKTSAIAVATLGQIHWNILNMGMNMQESTIGLNILNILKDCQRICGDFIFTMVCCDSQNDSDSSMHSYAVLQAIPSLQVPLLHQNYPWTSN